MVIRFYGPGSNPAHSAKMRNPVIARITGFSLCFQWFAGFSKNNLMATNVNLKQAS